ncbi:Vacuolar protein sorting-associated protein 54 [Aphelenchoides besseyi]|nr:Vacuolar protein sorting-associated protein 54 [Aphelenchoides besseyi]KAI6200026.1 Vacuolar protein sorting-associated protein 54 [Aphelenchoides besseyi]
MSDDHLQSHASGSKSPPLPRTCRLCQNRPQFVNESDIIQHVRLKHSKTKNDLVCKERVLLFRSIRSQLCASRRSRSPSRHLLPSVAMSYGEQLTPFTVNSFTQNLSSVLNDPRRTRYDTQVFFTRHWGEQYAPRSSVPTASSIPKIGNEEFRHYLATTAKKHKQYLKSKKALKRALAFHGDQSRFTIDDVPALFLTNDFSLRDPNTFEAVFLEPLDGDHDRIVSETELRRSLAGSISSRPDTANSLSRVPSTSSLVSSHSSQHQLPTDATEGRMFRSYHALQNRLELYDDVVSALLNHQLENKSEEFWKTVNSYGSSNLTTVQTRVHDRSRHILQLQHARENRRKLLQRLEDIACLRDAQTTVQMLLNQNDFPRALECIETAQEVLSSELKGVVCFRHLNSQLNELHRAIGKMLLEEFVTLIQREFGRPIEREMDCAYQEVALEPVIHGLLRCEEFKFVEVLRNEIVEAIKNIIRQIVKNRLVECEAMIPDYDPSLSLSEQMRKMSFVQWLGTLSAVFDSLFFFCCRILSIQNMIFENIDRVERLHRFRSSNIEETDEAIASNGVLAISSAMSFASLDMSTNNNPLGVETEEIDEEKEDSELETSTSEAADTSDHSIHMNGSIPKNGEIKSVNSTTASNGDINHKESTVSSAGVEAQTKAQDETTSSVKNKSAMHSFLSLPCRTLAQLKTVVPYLIDHTIWSAEERISKRLTTKYRDKFLERCSPENFIQFESLVRNFISRCRHLVRPESPLSLNDDSQSALTPQRSPLIAAIKIQTLKFVKSFHDTCAERLSLTLDHEQWKIANPSAELQHLADEFARTGDLHLADEDWDDGTSTGTSDSRTTPEPTSLISNKPIATSERLVIGDENFVAVRAAYLLLHMMAQYCNMVAQFPQCTPELLMHLIALLKSFNSRTCQLILGAGALQLVGLKTISVKTLALASRCLQLIVKFIPVVKRQFLAAMPERDVNYGRHFDTTIRDYNDHIEEIANKLIAVVDQHLTTGLNQWDLKSGIPSTAFQHVVRQIGKFYNGFAAVQPPTVTTEMLHRIHAQFKVQLAQHMIRRQITPHDSLNYGLAVQEFAYYIENMRAFPECLHFPADTIDSLPI